jgi:hypothetical protein
MKCLTNHHKMTRFVIVVLTVMSFDESSLPTQIERVANIGVLSGSAVTVICSNV